MALPTVKLAPRAQRDPMAARAAILDKLGLQPDTTNAEALAALDKRLAKRVSAPRAAETPSLDDLVTALVYDEHTPATRAMLPAVQEPTLSAEDAALYRAAFGD